MVEAEVCEQVVEARGACLVIEPGVVEQYAVVQLRGALGGRQVACQVTKLTHVVAIYVV